MSAPEMNKETRDPSAAGQAPAAPGNGPVLEIRDLSIALPRGGDRKRAVAGVSLTVNRGEIVCLVGESGSGKSVIAQAVMGLLPKQLPVLGGEILLEGENIAQASEARLRELRCVRMSMIFQEPMTALNPVMRCGAQIDEVLAMHTKLGAAERRQRVRQVIEEVGLPDPDRMYDSYPHQLSGGQRQRIMIAMALILEPVLLIADEPTTALDVTTQAQILRRSPTCSTSTAPGCCSSPTTSAWSPRSRTGSRCCAWATWSRPAPSRRC